MAVVGARVGRAGGRRARGWRGPAALAGALAALAAGLWLDGLRALTQPTLFWCFLGFGLSGAALGWAAGVRNDASLPRRLLAAAAALLAWRVAWFPLMVICGWLASVGEWIVHGQSGASVVYPTFLLLIFATNAAIAAIGAAVFAVPEGPAPRGSCQALRDRLHRPPRLLLLAIAAAALPVAVLVSFSQASDLTWFGDRPWRAPRPVPPIHEPESNPYERILREHELALPAFVLALNARITYPLVPEGPWGAAMKGTLEAQALAKPLATSQDRIDEHYLAYLAAHPRIRGR